MNYNLLISPVAELDLADAYRWYSERDRGLGREFLSAIDASISAIQRNPLAYPVVYKQIHRATLRKFPYGIFYSIEEEAVKIIACFHVKRDPQQWQNRADGIY